MSNKTAAKASDTPTSDASKKNGGNKKDAASPNGVQPEKEKVVDSASKAKSVDATTDGKSDDKEGKSGSDKGNDTEKTDSDGQDAATEEEEKAKKPAPRVLKPGEKEIRYNKKLPYKYEVSRIGELYTVVNRLGKVKEETSMKKSLQKKWAFYRKILPLLLRYVKETILPLGKRRLIIYFLGNILVTLIPSWQYRASLSLTELTRKALATGRLEKWEMLRAAAVDVGGFFATKMIRHPIEKNKDRLQYRYKSIIRAHIIKTKIRMDSVTSADEKVLARIESARKLQGDSWPNIFLPEHLSKIFSELSGLVSEALLVSQVASKGHGNIALLNFVVSVCVSLGTQLPAFWWMKKIQAVTNETYRRMDTMATLSEEAGAQDQLLGLRSYYYNEYQKAEREVGDARVTDARFSHSDDVKFDTWPKRLLQLVNRTSHVMIYVLFSLQTTRRAGGSVADTATAMSDLLLLEGSTKRLSRSIFELARHVKNLESALHPIESYYKLDSIKPLLKLRENPVPYTSSSAKEQGQVDDGSVVVQDTVSDNDKVSVAASDEDTLVNPSPAEPASSAPASRTGMKIEFKNVSFTYPHTKKKALDDVSFVIQAGQLCSIVGFSGSGKSTLIALLVRLHDPDSGSIYINDIDITWFNPEDLYRHISMLFQHTSGVDVTLKEFIGMGDVTSMEDEERIKNAAKESGAHEIIMKLPDGYETELATRHHWNDTIPEKLLMKRAHVLDQFDESRERSGTEDDDDDDVAKDDDEKDETTDEESLKKLLAVDPESIPAVDPKVAESTMKLALRCKLPVIPYNEAEVLTEGYDPSKLDADSEESAKFSGGEWAKIVLARSFLRRGVELLILDEFSAALDPMSEADIFGKFMNRLGKQTIIAVTHRFHLACKSDHILFLKGGKLLESGTHSELMQIENGEYKKMYECTTNNGSGKEIATQTGEEDDETSSSSSSKDEADKKGEDTDDSSLQTPSDSVVILKKAEAET